MICLVNILNLTATMGKSGDHVDFRCGISLCVSIDTPFLTKAACSVGECVYFFFLVPGISAAEPYP